MPNNHVHKVTNPILAFKGLKVPYFNKSCTPCADMQGMLVSYLYSSAANFSLYNHLRVIGPFETTVPNDIKITLNTTS